MPNYAVSMKTQNINTKKNKTKQNTETSEKN